MQTVTVSPKYQVVTSKNIRESLKLQPGQKMQVVVAMQKGKVINVNTSLALAAARLSLEYRLPMADSVILATALEFKAAIWTQDMDFKDIREVKYFPKKNKSTIKATHPIAALRVIIPLLNPSRLILQERMNHGHFR